MAFEEKNLELLRQLYEIKLKQYQKNQINLEEKINLEINLNNKTNAYELRKINYINRRKRLLQKMEQKTDNN